MLRQHRNTFHTVYKFCFEESSGNSILKWWRILVSPRSSSSRRPFSTLFMALLLLLYFLQTHIKSSWYIYPGESWLWISNHESIHHLYKKEAPESLKAYVWSKKYYFYFQGKFMPSLSGVIYSALVCWSYATMGFLCSK